MNWNWKVTNKTVLLAAMFTASTGSVIAENDNVAALRAEVDALRQEVKQAAEWKHPYSLLHMAGYADVGYTDAKSSNSTFNVGSFSPIFHYTYRDLVMMESELEFEIDAAGATTVAMEYMTVDLFLNDYAVLVAGKFLSPLGQFRQNSHPSWINKGASMPVGFGHGQAAPNGDVGVQVRGAVPMLGNTSNYAVYIGNDPVLELNPAGTEIEEIHTGGVGKDSDGKKVVGGRFGLRPMSNLEVGLSLASGMVAVSGETPRDYKVTDVDFNYRIFNLELRGEYVKQEVGAGGTIDPTAKEWKAYYVQAAYQFTPSKWEAVVRYGDYDTPDPAKDQKQWYAGINYLFASNIIGKLGYEMNNNPNAGQIANDRFLAQLAYGF